MACLGAALDKAFQAVLLKYRAKTKLISDGKIFPIHSIPIGGVKMTAPQSSTS